MVWGFSFFKGGIHMGRGVAYRYDYFMLIDEDYFLIQVGENEYENDEWAWKCFKDRVLDLFKANKISRMKESWYGPSEASYFGETDRLIIGIDYSGGMPCLFVEPKEWEDRWGNLKPYKIRKEVDRTFNRLVKEYEGLFYYPTSAWTTVKLKGYGLAS
jgi:hypothetical protein